MNLPGLHHITAVSGDPEVNYAFYVHTLGLRLIKKTVNQDDVSAYHLFYTDKAGSPGTDLTFFHWPHVASKSPGPGTVDRILFRAREHSVDYWLERLDDYSPEVVEDPAYENKRVIRFDDPEGQSLGIVAHGSDAPHTVPWDRSTVPAEHQLQGFAAVEIRTAPGFPTESFLTDMLDFDRLDDTTSLDGRTVQRYRSGRGILGDASGGDVHLLVDTEASGTGRVGIGGVHHIAFRVGERPEQDEIVNELQQKGIPNSGPVDRFYFRSVYFREPGGVLFEIATDGPGFAVDEDEATLGENLALPPFLEPRRAEIEAGLTPLETGSTK